MGENISEKIRTTNPKILALLERILLGEILGALCAFAVNGVTHFHRQGAKDAKKGRRRIVLRLPRPRFICGMYHNSSGPRPVGCYIASPTRGPFRSGHRQAASSC